MKPVCKNYVDLSEFVTKEPRRKKKGFIKMKLSAISIFIVCFMMTVVILVGEAAQWKDSVILYFPLDAVQGNKVIDSSPKNNDGEVTGNVKVVEGKFNKAFQFGTANDYVHIKNFKGMEDISQWSATAWVNMTKSTTADTLICAIGNGEAFRWNLGVYPGEIFHTNTCINSTWSSELNKTRAGEIVGKWVHMAAVYNVKDKSRTLYLNGKQSHNDNLLQGNATLTEIRIGAGQSNFVTWPWEGAIDDIAVFNTVLTENDINDIMNGINLSVESLGKLTTMWGHIKQYPE